MDTEPRKHAFREYFWFAGVLLLVLMGVATRENTDNAQRLSGATLAVSSTTH
jgi:hypothetical protein